MRNLKIATLVAFLVLVAVVAITQLKGQLSQQVEEVLGPSESQEQKGEVACVPSALTGHPAVHGLGIDFPLVPDADRVSYGDLGSVQYRADLLPEEVLGFYYDRVVNAMCGKVLAAGHNTATYQAGEGVVRIALSNPSTSDRTVIGYELVNARKVLGESYVNIAQADMSCPSDQVRCYGSDGTSNWCQMPPCPTYTPPSSTTPSTSCPSGMNWCSVTNSCIGPSDSCGSSSSSTSTSSTGSTSCSGDQVWCTSSSGSGGWCQYPPCPSTTSTTGTTSGTTCSGSYQQSGSTYPSCNYSTCPNGCTWGSDGCPSGCYTSPTCSGEYQQPGSSYPSCNNSKCPSGCNWSNGCPSGCYTPPSCSGEYQQIGSAYPMCNYSKCPNGCNYGSDGCPSGCYTSPTSCPSGQYLCNGACVANTTSCGTAGGGMTCPSNQYWCNGACVPMGSTCSSTGGITQESCTSAGGLWCQPTTAPHCHSGPNPTPCEPDTAGGTYCPSNQYWCNGVCVPMSTTCTSTATSCPSGQYMCNGSCVANTASCSPTAWPADQASCTAGGKYWCMSSSSYAGGMSSSSGWCQSMPCSTTTTSCAAGTYWCSSINSCVSNSTSCSSVPPNPTPTPQPQVQCGQCQIEQNRQCVKAPAGTKDSRCGSGAVCDQYGGCITLSGIMKFVGNGAICGDKFCNPELGEDRVNCPNECRNDPQPLPRPVEPGPPVNANIGVQPPPRIIESGPSEEELSRMRQRDFENMKKNVEQFAKGVERMRKYIQSAKARLLRRGVGIPVQLENALARAPELLVKLRAAKTFEEFEFVMPDVQDIAMELDDWRTRIGDLDRLAGMLTQMNRDVRKMATEFNRAKTAVKGKPELQDAFKEFEALFGVLSKRAADAKVLAKNDPEQGLEEVEAFYGEAEEFWSQVSLLNMLRDVRKGLSQANTEQARAERRVNQLVRKKGVDPALIVELRAILQQIKALIPELKAAINTKPLDFEAVRDLAEQLWGLIEEFENLMAQNGQGVYVPTVKRGAGVDFVIPEGFIPQAQGVPSFGSQPNTNQ